MKPNCKNIVTALVLAILPGVVTAKNDIEKYHEEILEMSIDDNLQHPDVPKKHIEEAVRRMAALAERFTASGVGSVDVSERGGLVVMLTMPVSDFFAPNDTILKGSALRKLVEISNPLSTPDRYKVLVTVHSDDTGDEEYLNNLTRARADAIVAWLAGNGRDTKGIVPYGVGYDEPLNSEQSRAGRAKNRRVELYFLPGPVMIDEIKSGRPQ